MKTKKALLLVEPTKKAFDRFAAVLKNPLQAKYKDCTILT